MIFKYKIRCSTENADKFWYLDQTNPPPTKCPTNTAHAVDLASVAVVQIGGPNEVVTQAEKNDKDKKLAKGKVVVTIGQLGVIILKIPGAPNLDGDGNPVDSPNDRWINGGVLMCNQAQEDDWIEIDVLAPDGITVVKTFTEEAEGNDAKNGWWMDPVTKLAKLITPSPAHGYAGFYLRLTYHASNAGTERHVFLNIDWDQKE